MLIHDVGDRHAMGERYAPNLTLAHNKSTIFNPF